MPDTLKISESNENPELDGIKNALKGLKWEILGTKGKVEDTDEPEIPFETIKGPEDINSKNVCAITRELFEKILKGEDLSQYSQVIMFLNQKFNDKQQVIEFANAFGIADTTLNSLLQDGNLQNVLAWPETYTWAKPYDQAVKYLFINLFPREELLIIKDYTPEEKFKKMNFEGLKMDDTDLLKQALQWRAKNQTLDSMKNYFWERRIVEKEIQPTSKQIVPYVVIRGTSFKIEKEKFDIKQYEKNIIKSLQETYYDEQKDYLNQILKEAWKPLIE